MARKPPQSTTLSSDPVQGDLPAAVKSPPEDAVPPTIEQHRITMILRADQPICHLSESIGNSGILATRRVRQPGGGFAEVPMLSGDSLRHALREAGSMVVLAGSGNTANLTEAGVRLLFAGGMVTGDGEGTSKSIRMGDYRKMVDLIPPLALLGGCAENRTIPGCINVSDATLVCAEYAHRLPSWVVAFCEENGNPHWDTFRASVEEPQRVRMDPSLFPDKRALMTSDEARTIEARLDANELASREKDAPGRKATKSTMIPRRFERISEGSYFVWDITVSLRGPLMVDTFYTMLNALAANFIAGGKRATGHGRMSVVKAHRTILRAANEAPAVESLALAVLDPGQEAPGFLLLPHLRDRAEQIRDFLQGVNA